MLRRPSRIRATLGREAGCLLSAGVALLPGNAWACAVCVGWTGRQGTDSGFYWSALLLTALPFAVVAVIGAWLVRAARRPRQAPATPEPVGAEKR